MTLPKKTTLVLKEKEVNLLNQLLAKALVNGDTKVIARTATFSSVYKKVVRAKEKLK